MVKSVCLFLSKKGHRKTFAKKKLFGRALGMLWPGPFSEALPSGEAGVSAAAGAAASALGGPMPLLPTPHQGKPAFPWVQVCVSLL